jgi:glucose/arabinose dehydrogenase
MELFNKYGIGGIIRMNRDGTGREVYATGLRNPVGMDFNPANGELWSNDNQVDGMGDDIPPGELNRITKPGENFGFPWYGGGSVRTVEYKDSEPPADAVPPAVETIAHAADLGLVFYTGKQFPEKYRGGMFTAPRLLEPHRAGRGTGALHPDQRRRIRRPAGGVRRRLA